MKKENIFDLYAAQHKDEPAHVAERVPGEVTPEDVTPTQEATPAPEPKQEATPEPKQEATTKPKQEATPEPKQEATPEPKQEPETQKGGNSNGV